MSVNEELQKQIDDLKATVARLQEGETRFESMPKRMQRIRKRLLKSIMVTGTILLTPVFRLLRTVNHGQIVTIWRPALPA